MTNRREFLQIGIAASTLPLAAQAARAAGIDLAEREDGAFIPLYKVVYDTRFADSVAFARRAEALGVAGQPITGDMTRFWYDDLYHRWREGPAAIAGVTGHGPMFVLERLAWDQGMRVVFRAEHTYAAGCVQHNFSGPLAMLQSAARGAADVDWAAGMADVLTRCPSGRSEIAQGSSLARVNHAHAGDADALFSWVIAPATRA